MSVTIAGVDTPVILRRNPRASRFTLRVNQTRRQVILTLPTFSRVDEASDFLSCHLDWLQEKLDELPAPVPFANGAIVPLRGQPHRIIFAGPHPGRRGIAWIEKKGKKSRRNIASLQNCPRLCVSGGYEHAPRRLTDWLKKQARKDLNARVTWHADRLDVTPKRIFIRDQSSRWGSCSTTGSLSFSWRLILAPSLVLDYVAAHEVAHLREMNHGSRFWHLVKETMPEMEDAQAWLKEFGVDLHRYGT